jgi:hypothetical protein
MLFTIGFETLLSRGVEAVLATVSFTGESTMGSGVAR